MILGPQENEETKKTEAFRRIESWSKKENIPLGEVFVIPKPGTKLPIVLKAKSLPVSPHVEIDSVF